MARRRRRRRIGTQQPPRAERAVSAPRSSPVVQAAGFERLAYSCRQAAESLGISVSTFNRRVLPLIETVRMPSGTLLVPVDELERILAERRQPVPATAQPPGRPGRRPNVPDEILARILCEHAAGRSLAEIAREFNSDKVATRQGGRQWWPSTIRSILTRTGK